MFSLSPSNFVYNNSSEATTILTEGGYHEVRRKKYIQWSILQHYGVCETPLLDFTHSIRVACSFAHFGSDSKHGYLFVFALPYITNRISINSEHDLVNIRLLSICPPDALRPYYQDGYLAGTEDITMDYDSKTELDFKNRLIAKFKIPNNRTFWGKGLSKIPEFVLYPEEDRIGELCKELEIFLENELRPSEMGEFLKQWAKLEEGLTEKAEQSKSRMLSIRKIILLLKDRNQLDENIIYELEAIRHFRNRLVHRPNTLKREDVPYFLDRLKDVQRQLREI